MALTFLETAKRFTYQAGTRHMHILMIKIQAPLDQAQRLFRDRTSMVMSLAPCSSLDSLTILYSWLGDRKEI
jgi:hypothetical protein